MKCLLKCTVFGLSLLLWTPLSNLAGNITGSFSSLTTNVDLTTAGKTDWVHWGLYTDTSVDRKWGVPAQIGDLGTVSSFGGYTFVYQYSDNYNGYTWYDGWPDIGVTNSTTGVWAYQSYPIFATNWGFEFTAPADTTNRTLLVYVGAFAARGELSATLSDGGTYTDRSLFNETNGPGAVYTLNYQAASPGQILTVKWVLVERAFGQYSSQANVTLQAAALSDANADNPPVATMTSPVNQSVFTAPASISLSADATDFDGTVTNVTFFQGTNLLGSSRAAPFTANWNNVGPGHYYLTAQATDDGGMSRVSLPTEAFVYGTGGSLNGSVVAPPAVLDLTAEGTNDWVHWGLVTNTSIDRKSGVVPQIGFAVMGLNTVQQYTDNFTAFSWSDGTPTPAATNSATGIFITGLTNGFCLTAPADLTQRRLRVYVGCYGVVGSFEGFLSDFSAPPYIDNSTADQYGNAYSEYELDYTAASPGQQLTVLFQAQKLYDFAYGNVTLQAATVAGGPMPPAQVLLTNPQVSGSTLVFSFMTQLGHNYTVQFAPSLPTTTWSNLSTLAGTGSVLTVTNQVPPGANGFYRVQIQ